MSPKIIHNIMEQVGEDIDLDEDIDVLDGADELESWAQDKIKKALRQGHVDDEDWKGVSCLWHVIAHTLYCVTSNVDEYAPNLLDRIQSSTVQARKASRNARLRRKPRMEMERRTKMSYLQFQNPRRMPSPRRSKPKT